MLEFENVSFCFEKGNDVLKNVSFTVSSGECVLLAGPNGSGKTVLMKHCNALLSPRRGSVRYNGLPLEKQLPLVRQKIGIVFQNSDAQFVGQTLREDIGFGPENLGWEKRRVEQAVEESARMLGIVHLLDRHPHFLSGGEKKKAAIAGIVAMEPEIIVMDEPFAGLDYRGVCAVAREIASLKASGRTLLVITHDIEKILAHVSRMMVMHSGNIVYDGPPVMDSRLFEDNMIRFPRGLSVEACTWL